MKSVLKLIMATILVFTGDIRLNAEEIEGQLNAGVFTNENLPLKDVELTIYDENEKKVTTMTTDEMGEARSEMLPGGEYTVRQTKVPTGYALNKNTFSATIANPFVIEDINQGNPIINYPIDDGAYGQITGKLVDENNKGISGVDFAIYDDIGTNVGLTTTDENGDFLTDDLAAGLYTIKQSTQAQGYYQDANYYEAEITSNGEIIKVNGGKPIVNNSIKGADTGNICTRVVNEQGEAIVGAEFTLFNEEEIPVAIEESNDYGVIYFPTIQLGNYTVRETRQLSDYYLDKTIYDASLTKKDQELKINNGKDIVNYVIKGQEGASTGTITENDGQYANCQDAFNDKKIVIDQNKSDDKVTVEDDKVEDVKNNNETNHENEEEVKTNKTKEEKDEEKIDGIDENQSNSESNEERESAESEQPSEKTQSDESLTESEDESEGFFAKIADFFHRIIEFLKNLF